MPEYRLARTTLRRPAPLTLFTVVLLACLLAPSPALAQGAGLFVEAPQYPVGMTPKSVAVGDFNGDGKPDLVVANQGSGTVSVLLGNGDGTFKAHVDYPTGLKSSYPTSLAVGDFNGDGRLDLAVADAAGVSVLLGNGDGTFQAHVDYSIGTGGTAVAVGDFNGDGKLDLAVSGWEGPLTTAFVSVLIGKGDGTFQPPVDYPLGFQASPSVVAVGDFNGDGKLDLIAGGELLLGNGDGTFQAPLGTGATWASPLAVGDFNGDGKLDLAVVYVNSDTGLGQAAVLLGNGDGTFHAAAYYSTGHNPSSVAVGDFNGDGKLDMAVANSGENTVTILLGNGDGTFQPRVDYGAGDGPQSVAVGDFNGDGKLDLAVAFSASNDDYPPTPGVAVLLGNGGKFQARADYPLGVYDNPTSVAVGAFRGNGKLDLVLVSNNRSTVSVLLGNGDGSFQTSVDYPTGSVPYSVAVGDFNRDGKLDIVTANYGGYSVSVLLGNGDGTFQPHVDYPAGSLPVSVAVGDFNGDGNPDLVVADYGVNEQGNTVSVLLGNGDGTFQPPVQYATGTAPYSVAVGDFNGDGKLDLAVADQDSNAVSILLGKGDGTFQTHVDYAVAGRPRSTVVVGDFTGDGRLDLAVGPGLSVLLGNGDGTFQNYVFYPYETGAALAVGDFNGDGKLDLAVLGTDSIGYGAVGVLLGNGDGTFQPPVEYSTGLGAFVAVGDFRNEGVLDVASANTYNNTVSILLNASGAPPLKFSPASLIFADQLINTSSASQPVTLTNNTSGAISISSIQIVGVDAGSFSETTTCGSSLAPGASCTVSVTFTPTEKGTLTAGLAVKDNGTQTITLTGTCIAPVVGFAPASLTFAGQIVGTTSAAQTVTLTNSGNAPLSITSIAVTGANAGDFAQTNTCGTSVAAGANCAISVTFTPTASGTRTGTITITDNAAGSPQSVALTGTGLDFTVGAAPGSSTSATVTAGQAATYLLAFNGTTGLNGTLSFTCSGAPQLATCSVTPNPLTLTGGTTATAAVTVSTTARGMSPMSRTRPPNSPWPRDWPLGALPFAWCLALLVFTATWIGRKFRGDDGESAVAGSAMALRSGAAAMLLFVALLAGLTAASCGGGSTTPPPNPGTPPGTYTLNVVATLTSGTTTLTHNIQLTLTVH